MLDVFVRVKSFEPNVTNLTTRLYDAYAAEVARVDQNHDGVLTFIEADAEDESDGLSNERLYLPPTTYNRFAVTRELNDGLLAPRLAPSQRAYVLTGSLVRVSAGRIRVGLLARRRQSLSMSARPPGEWGGRAG